jgi:proteic killer suppression protein
VEIKYKDEGLLRLARGTGNSNELPVDVLSAFHARIAVVRAAEDERDLLMMRSLKFEPLSAGNPQRHSIGLPRGCKLIVELHGDSPCKELHVLSIQKQIKE